MRKTRLTQYTRKGWYGPSLKVYGTHDCQLCIRRMKKKVVVPWWNLLMLIAHLLTSKTLAKSIWINSCSCSCSCMPKLYDIGKKLGVKILKQNFQLTSVDDMNLDQKIDDNKSIRFTLSCYGMRKHKTTSRSRFAVWGRQAESKSLISSPKLELLHHPPTIFWSKTFFSI